MNLKLFLKDNKIEKENTTYKATKSLCDENGEPLEWVIRPVTTKVNERMRDDCMYEVPVTGKPNQYRTKMDVSKYLSKLITASVVEPNLLDKDLQDSYGVMTPEDLVKEMIDDSGEYNNFVAFIQEYNGFTETLAEKVEEAKN